MAFRNAQHALSGDVFAAAGIGDVGSDGAVGEPVPEPGIPHQRVAADDDVGAVRRVGGRDADGYADVLFHRVGVTHVFQAVHEKGR